MAVLLENVANCLSLAFVSLYQDKAGFVNKSKLKVLTANIGTLLDLYGVEKGLEHFKEAQCLDFLEYKQYLQKEVFSSLPEYINLNELRDCERKIAEVCWLVCRKNYIGYEKQFTQDSIFKIFRIFCLLAELSFHDDQRPQVLLHPSEASMIAQKLTASLGNSLDEDDFTHLCVSMGEFQLGPFLTVLTSRCFDQVTEKEAIIEAVQDLYQYYIEDVMKKGSLFKRGYIFHTLKEYWFVLRPCELSYYKSLQEKEKCGAINLQPGNRVEIKPDFKLVIHTPERNFEFACPDRMSRLQWYSALQNAIEYSGGTQSYQRLEAAKRRKQRLGRMHEMLMAKEQLMFEKSARKMAEGQAKELEGLVREDSKKLMELQMMKERLEKLLEEETQAKEDEEIVRALQARVLAEEWEKREELERLQKEQIVLLEEECKKRMQYELLQKQNELQLKDAQRRLAILQSERQHLDEQLKIALSKIKLSETRKEDLEARLQEIQNGVILRIPNEANKIRRAHSFMPCTKERPVVFEVRSPVLMKK